MRYMRLYPCSKLFLVWRAHTHKMATLRGSLVAFRDHTLHIWFRRWRELTRTSVKLTSLEAEEKKLLGVGRARRYIQLWREALRRRMSECSQEAIAIRHHSRVVTRGAFSKWRLAYQHEATVEAERVCDIWDGEEGAVPLFCCWYVGIRVES